MNSFVQADIFFFITTIFTTIIFTLAIVCLFYLARILKSIKEILTKVQQEGDRIISSIENARAKISSNSGILSSLFGFVMTSLRRSRTRGAKKTSRKSKTSSEEL